MVDDHDSKSCDRKVMRVQVPPRAPNIMSLNKRNLSYIIGLALGDGNLSNPNGRAVRLRITCDLKYMNLIKRIRSAIQILLPKNKVSLIKRSKTFCDVSCYSNKWEDWLGWKAKKGSKYKQKVSIPNWVKENKNYSIYCLKGLLETDGSIYTDRGYKMVNFVTIIPGLANDVIEIIKKIGFSAHIYKIATITKTRYNIRLSKNIDNFLKIINFIKN